MRALLSLLLFIPVLISSCTYDPKVAAQVHEGGDTMVPPGQIEEYYRINKGNDSSSISSGTVSRGKLAHGKLMPFSGKNFSYFDEWSYLQGRAFVNNRVRDCILDCYHILEVSAPGRRFYIMECSNKEGGPLYPHKTHQNGLSVDFMMPKLKGSSPCYALDTLGTGHYWLEFNNRGQYIQDTSIALDFDLIALHMLLLNKQASRHGLKVSKVIIKIELKDELFRSGFGNKLQESGIYIVHSLGPQVNAFHDEHYHIDFEPL